VVYLPSTAPCKTFFTTHCPSYQKALRPRRRPRAPNSFFFPRVPRFSPPATEEQKLKLTSHVAEEVPSERKRRSPPGLPPGLSKKKDFSFPDACACPHTIFRMSSFDSKGGGNRELCPPPGWKAIGPRSVPTAFPLLSRFWLLMTRNLPRRGRPCPAETKKNKPGPWGHHKATDEVDFVIQSALRRGGVVPCERTSPTPFSALVVSNNKGRNISAKKKISTPHENETKILRSKPASPQVNVHPVTVFFRKTARGNPRKTAGPVSLWQFARRQQPFSHFIPFTRPPTLSFLGGGGGGGCQRNSISGTQQRCFRRYFHFPAATFVADWPISYAEPLRPPTTTKSRWRNRRSARGPRLGPSYPFSNPPPLQATLSQAPPAPGRREKRVRLRARRPSKLVPMALFPRPMADSSPAAHRPRPPAMHCGFLSFPASASAASCAKSTSLSHPCIPMEAEKTAAAKFFARTCTVHRIETDKKRSGRPRHRPPSIFFDGQRMFHLFLAKAKEP